MPPPLLAFIQVRTKVKSPLGICHPPWKGPPPHGKCHPLWKVSPPHGKHQPPWKVPPPMESTTPLWKVLPPPALWCMAMEAAKYIGLWGQISSFILSATSLLLWKEELQAKFSVSQLLFDARRVTRLKESIDTKKTKAEHPSRFDSLLRVDAEVQRLYSEPKNKTHADANHSGFLWWGAPPFNIWKDFFHCFLANQLNLWQTENIKRSVDEQLVRAFSWCQVFRHCIYRHRFLEWPSVPGKAKLFQFPQVLRLEQSGGLNGESASRENKASRNKIWKIPFLWIFRRPKLYMNGSLGSVVGVPHMFVNRKNMMQAQ